MAADVLQAKFKMRVLVNRMVPAVKRGCADVDPLLFGHFLGLDQTRRIARPGSGNGGIIGMRKCVAQSDARGGAFNAILGKRRCGKGHVPGHCTPAEIDLRQNYHAQLRGHSSGAELMSSGQPNSQFRQ